MRVLPPVQLLPGDVLIMGSDGLWDNVADNEVLDVVLTVLNCLYPCIVLSVFPPAK
jgi:serine/threonine protein phosphatase PrpC